MPVRNRRTKRMEFRSWVLKFLNSPDSSLNVRAVRKFFENEKCLYSRREVRTKLLIVTLHSQIQKVSLLFRVFNRTRYFPALSCPVTVRFLTLLSDR